MDFLGDIFSHLPAEPDATGRQDMVFSVGGSEYAIPNPQGLGSATFTGEDGVTTVSDLDGDGHVDYVSNVSYDGKWTAWRPDGAADAKENGQQMSEPVEGVAESTPNEVSKTWDAGRWECVDRGEWG
ncbi:DUF6802 family protein [uncultured Corynebacterium sp.]|uniref:DUF6802 family protein n=1 Tax=uncultured Corynebacterium sp. TaxID=159447 RepID=UPI0028898506|nr:DUF6802 family protein [uncultured Corynebacterium sp.]